MRADIGVIDLEKHSLVAVVEVGELSRPDKCQEWEAALQSVKVIHIRKADVEMSRFTILAEASV